MLIVATVALVLLALAAFCAIPLAFALLARLIISRFIGRR